MLSFSPMNYKPLWLVGMMGSGKTTVAQVLGERLGLPVRDTDAIIEAQTGLSIADIFEREGEAQFRKLEREVVEKLVGREGIVALGGGAVIQPEIAARVAESGVSIYLRANARTLAERVGAGDARPLLKGMDDAQRLQALDKLLLERRAAYQRADIVVDVDAHTPAGVADRIQARLAEREAGRQAAGAAGAAGVAGAGSAKWR